MSRLLAEDGAEVLGLEEEGWGGRWDKPPPDNLLIIIPARGGSKRLFRKNMLPIEGKPMFVHTATHWSLPKGRVVVATDDQEIAHTARAHQLEVCMRTPVPDDQTIPQMARVVMEALEHHGPVLVVQPTLTNLLDAHFIQLVLSDVPTMMAGPGRDQVWDGSTHHWNPKLLRSIGAYFWPVGTVGELPEQAYSTLWDPIDIDTPADYRAAVAPKYVYSQQYASAATWSGTGHERRQQTLALYMQHHCSEFEAPGEELPDLILLDQGDSTIDLVAEERARNWGARIITFEDRGPGAHHADAVINAILPPIGAPNEYVGGKYAILRPEFLGLRHEGGQEGRIGVVFGGTDAKNLTDWVQHHLGGAYDYVTPPIDHMAYELLRCELLICGAGQIVQEAAHLGVPTIVIAATQREASHGHLGPQYGNIFLGLSAEVTLDRLKLAVKQVQEDKELREEMSKRSRKTVDGRGHERVLNIIERVMLG